MLPLVFAAIVFFFLLVGAVAFLFCAIIPPLRRYSLSVALWCAVWGPSSIVFLLIAGTAVIADAFIARSGDMQSLHSPRLVHAIGWGYLAAACLTTTAIASLAAWLHQILIHRLTFLLFRLYATLVGAGIGSVFGWGLGWSTSMRQIPHILPFWLFSIVVLTLGFGVMSYRGASGLRGEPPVKFTWISAEEFNGT